MVIVNNNQIGVISRDGYLYTINTSNPNELKIDG